LFGESVSVNNLNEFGSNLVCFGSIYIDRSSLLGPKSFVTHDWIQTVGTNKLMKILLNFLSGIIVHAYIYIM
jgi:hypothetical protein